jgi:hypothetical protein
MRTVVPLIGAAVLLLLAGCTGESGDPDGPAESEGPQAWDKPVEVQIAAPAGFVPVDEEERADLMAPTEVTQIFGLDGDEFVNDRLIVTSYLLDEGVDTTTYESQLELVLAYDEARGVASDLAGYYPTLVHRADGIHRYVEFPIDDGDTERPVVKQSNYYLFSGNRAIQITCQWRYHFEDVSTACSELTQNFTHAEDW